MRVVVKIGTNVIVDKGEINLEVIYHFARTIVSFSQSHQIIVVTSGAVALGSEQFETEKSVVGKMASAAVGQPKLMNVYGKFFEPLTVAQLLYTYDDLSRRRVKVKKVIELLLQKGIILIINENDATTAQEIKKMASFGDNARLAAMVARLVDADLLVLLSDVDGLYSADPRGNSEVDLIRTVEILTKEIMAAASDLPTAKSRGGMRANLEAALLAKQGGIPTIIANGRRSRNLVEIFSGGNPGTLILARKKIEISRQR